MFVHPVGSLRLQRVSAAPFSRGAGPLLSFGNIGRVWVRRGGHQRSKSLFRHRQRSEPVLTPPATVPTGTSKRGQQALVSAPIGRCRMSCAADQLGDSTRASGGLPA